MVHIVGQQSDRVCAEGCSEHKALFKVERSNPDSHKFSVTSAVWYPIDTGMFVSGSFDQEVKVRALLLITRFSHQLLNTLKEGMETQCVAGAADLGYKCASSGVQLHAASQGVCSRHVPCGCSTLLGGSGRRRSTGG